MEIQDARTLSADAQEAIRRRAVQAVREGMTQGKAAHLFGVARPTVNRWLRQYHAAGDKGLAAHPQGRPQGQGLLRPDQVGLLLAKITRRAPDQLGLPFVLWTRQAVAALVERLFGVRVSLVSVGKWLRHWGLTPQKPVRKAWEQDPKEVEHWLKTQYPAIRQEALEEKAEIHWGDEMGLRSDHQAGTSYGRKGKTPVIAGTGQRWRLNVISSLTNRGTLRFMIFSRSFSSAVFIEFMRRLVRGARRRVYLIVDGHPVHHSAQVRQWAQKHREQIRLIPLPAYSPELNPDEFLNHDVKQNAVGRRRAKSGQQMQADVRGYLRSTQQQPEIVKRFFHAPSVQYAMA